MRATAVSGEGSGSNPSWVLFFGVGLLLIVYGVPPFGRAERPWAPTADMDG